MKKLIGRWAHHELSEQNRMECVRICSENLAKFDDGTWRLCDTTLQMVMNRGFIGHKYERNNQTNVG